MPLHRGLSGGLASISAAKGARTSRGRARAESETAQPGFERAEAAHHPFRDNDRYHLGNLQACLSEQGHALHGLQPSTGHRMQCMWHRSLLQPPHHGWREAQDPWHEETADHRVATDTLPCKAKHLPMQGCRRIAGLDNGRVTVKLTTG